MKILLAEDDANLRLVLTTMLGKWGYTVVEAKDGNEAWAILQKPDAPQLAIVDWVMPGLTGVEICDKLHKSKKSRPTYVILLTSRGAVKDIVEGLTAGANDYVTKPYINDELRARVGVGRRMVELQNLLSQRVAELQDALAHIKRLQGIIPICSHCHRIRTDKAGWERLEKYIQEHSEAKFSHGLCPDCMKEHYSEALNG